MRGAYSLFSQLRFIAAINTVGGFFDKTVRKIAKCPCVVVRRSPEFVVRVFDVRSSPRGQHSVSAQRRDNSLNFMITNSCSVGRFPGLEACVKLTSVPVGETQQDGE